MSLLVVIRFVWVASVFIWTGGIVHAADLINALERGLMPGDLHRTHAKLESDCSNCHEAFKKTRRDELCVSCHDHERIANDRRDKTGYHGSLAVRQRSCASCHREHQGRDAALVMLNKPLFDHAATNFVLEGVHRAVVCENCHSGKSYRKPKYVCIECHRKQDVHEGRFGSQCVDCHGQDRWFEVSFPHDKTQFNLRGNHQSLPCAACHVGGQYLTVSKECGGCHGRVDVHNGLWGERCERCHSEKGWLDARFDHAKTKFSLLGKHEVVKCEACHDTKRDLKNKRCVNCHRDEHTGRYAEKCAYCHGTADWKVRRFRHRFSGFALNDTHQKINCESCHLPKEKTPKTCVGCHSHRDVHRGKQDEKCDQCHDEKNWRPASGFDHGLTRFPLLASHAGLACEECHQDRTYVEKRDCVSCHEKNDKHKGVLGKNCVNCHAPSSWKAWRFDHDKQSKFALNGAHKGIVCTACHISQHKNAKEAPKDCVSCHLKQDIHVGRFGTACERCHWEDKFSRIKKEVTR